MIAFKLALQMLLTMFLGFIAKRSKIVDNHTVKRFSRLLFQIGIPCIILNSMNIHFDPQQFKSALIVFAMGFGVLGIIFICGTIYRKLCHRHMLGAIAQFGMMFPNYAFIGTPIMQALFGATGLFYYAVFTTPVRILYYSVPSFILDQNSKDKFSAKELFAVFLSPQLIAVYAGLIIYLGRITLPDIVSNVLSNGSTFASTGGIMLCGMLIADCNPHDLFKNPTLFVLPLVKNVLLPVIVMLCVMFLPVDPYASKVCVMYAALPLAAMLPIFVMKYTDDPKIHETCSLYVAISTVLSVGTLPLVSWLIDTFIH